MFRIHGSETGKFCDGITRRNFVQLGMAGMASVGLPQILRAREASSELGHPKKDTAVILFWLDGGPSHIDMYDMKPEAPAEYRGIWKPTKTNVPGMDISELMPKQAKMADKFAIVRSLHHDSADHYAGAHVMLTGRWGANGADFTPRYPSLGSVAAKVCGPRKAGIPPYVSIPLASSIGLKMGYHGGSYLGVQYNPFETDGDPNTANFQVRNVGLSPGLTLDRLEDRRGLLKHFDKIQREMDASRAMDSMDRFERDAYEMVAGSAARDAFDLTKETPETRDRYGRTHWGQCRLLARRMVEAGSTFVTVNTIYWDLHNYLHRNMEIYLPSLDAALTALIEDLHARQMAEKVLIVMFGDFGRTPRMNDGANFGPPGRDHWGNAAFCWLSGGGIKGGQVYGATNERAEMPKDKPVEPWDIAATIYHVLGIDPTLNFSNNAGRPIPLLDGGRVIEELF